MKNFLRAILLTTLFPLATFGGTLTVNNGSGATNITSTSAWISATIVSTGAANPYLFSYWGTNDGGTNASAWHNTNAYGEAAQGSHSAQITGLSGSTIYYFRAYGSNSTSSVAWASYSAQFRTLNTPTSAPPSSVRAVAVGTNGVLMNPTNFFHTNSPQIADALAGRFGVTNAIWGNISGAITDQADLTNALGQKADAAAIPVVGITPGTFYDGAQGDAVSNAVAGLTNDVAVLQTNTATKAQGALADTALQVEADTNALFQLNAHATNVTNPHAVTAAQIGAATGSPLYEFTEVDPAYATGAVQIAGATMTGPMTNLFGYFGNGAGLTNLASDPSGWSGYAATQQVVWYSDEIADNTNYLVISGSSEPETAGVYQWANSNEEWAYWKGGDLKVAPQGEVFWYIFTSFGEFRNASNDPTAGGYDAYFNATGTVSAAYGKMTNTIPWRAGYDTNIGAWAVSRNGTNVQTWFPSSNLMAGPVVIGGFARTNWPIEYDDSALAGNLSVVSNQAAAGSNLAATVAVNLSVVSNWTVAVSNLSANALPTTGGTMSGPLTNEHGYFGDGSGLTNLPGSTPFDGTELSNSVAGLGILITNVASNALSMDGGGTVTGDVAVTGRVTAGTLALTKGPVAGSVWVCTNSNGSGQLRVLAKMRLKPYGSALISDVNATNKWNATAVYRVGGLTGTVNGVKIHRDGSYWVGMNWVANYCTNPAQVGRAAITRNAAVIAETEYNSRIANNAIQSVQTLVTEASAGDIIGVSYILSLGESSGQTNLASAGGQLSVVEMP